MSTRNSALALALLALLAGAVSACAADEPALTLAESKSPAQLLRNDAGSRIPSEAVAKVDETTDVSIACGGRSEDPDELMRAWQSSAEITLTAEAAASTVEIVDGVVDSYLDQGWSDRSLGGAGDYARFLSGPSSSAVLSIVGTHVGSGEPKNADGTPAYNAIAIEVHGPCVKTDGPDSDYVTDLENVD